MAEGQTDPRAWGPWPCMAVGTQLAPVGATPCQGQVCCWEGGKGVGAAPREGEVTVHQRGPLQSHLWSARQGEGPGEGGAAPHARQAGSADRAWGSGSWEPLHCAAQGATPELTSSRAWTRSARSRTGLGAAWLDSQCLAQWELKCTGVFKNSMRYHTACYRKAHETRAQVYKCI